MSREAEHRIDVIDPLSALVTQLLRAAHANEPCEGLHRVFSGQSRFDVEIKPSRIVAGEVVCSAKVQQIAGHLQTRSPMAAPVVTVAFRTKDTGMVRLPTRIELSQPIGTLLIRRAS